MKTDVNFQEMMSYNFSCINFYEHKAMTDCEILACDIHCDIHCDNNCDCDEYTTIEECDNCDCDMSD